MLQPSRVSQNSLITDPVHLCSIFNKQLLYDSILLYSKGVFKGGGVQGVQTPPEIFRIFLKSEGKEIERKRKKRDVGGGGGLPLNIFLGLLFFRVGLRYFQGGLKNFREGLRNLRGWLRNFRGGLRNFRGGG